MPTTTTTTTIIREDLPDDYKEMLDTESHHQHEIVMIDGVFRWKENEDVINILEKISLNHLCPLLCVLGHGKNSEVYRKLYRDMGYSLSGYWDIFYWDVNNPECDEYQPGRSVSLQALFALRKSSVRY